MGCTVSKEINNRRIRDIRLLSVEILEKRNCNTKLSIDIQKATKNLFIEQGISNNETQIWMEYNKLVGLIDLEIKENNDLTYLIEAFMNNMCSAEYEEITKDFRVVEIIQIVLAIQKKRDANKEFDDANNDMMKKMLEKMKQDLIQDLI
jgi:hypothetical protein